jgi:hypothetical protein
METFSTLGDALTRRYVKDFAAGMAAMRGDILPPELRCTRCDGCGLEWESKINGAKCKACNGRKIPAIPYSELINGEV